MKFMLSIIFIIEEDFYLFLSYQFINKMETTNSKMDISNENVKGVLDILYNVQPNNKEDFLKTSEYRDFYNGERLYNRNLTSKVYVSKRANDESDFWKGGKYCYDDPTLKKEQIYLTTNRKDYGDFDIPDKFKSKEFNRTDTRISEYSNALYNNNVFQNPRFISC